jgi:hypothetical protein
MLPHFVTTRIGLGVYNEAWYRRMIDIFEAITFPSLMNQTSQNFDWMIAIDAGMPAAARRRLEEVLADRTNCHFVAIDMTALRHLRLGGSDWVSDHCRDYILAHELVADPTDYVITSLIDADDAWHCDTIANINAHFAARMEHFRAMEPTRANTIRHSSGMIASYAQGLQWYLPTNAATMEQIHFLGTSIFLSARLSCGISADSIRHHQWPAFAQAMGFAIDELESDNPMWIYVRHERSSESWGAGDARPLDAAMTELLERRFGIDMERVRRLRTDPPADKQNLASHIGRSFGSHVDRLYRLAAINRQIDALERRVEVTDASGTNQANGALCDLLARRKAERAKAITAFREAGDREYR